MSELQINSLVCVDQQEVFTDELYILVNGDKVWSGRMTQGDSIIFDDLDIQFDHHAQIELWENDGNHWWDRNDHIGTNTVYSSQEPDPLNFEGRGAEYHMTYDILV